MAVQSIAPVQRNPIVERKQKRSQASKNTEGLLGAIGGVAGGVAGFFGGGSAGGPLGAAAGATSGAIAGTQGGRALGTAIGEQINPSRIETTTRESPIVNNIQGLNISRNSQQLMESIRIAQQLPPSIAGNASESLTAALMADLAQNNTRRA